MAAPGLRLDCLDPRRPDAGRPGLRRDPVVRRAQRARQRHPPGQGRLRARGRVACACATRWGSSSSGAADRHGLVAGARGPHGPDLRRLASALGRLAGVLPQSAAPPPPRRRCRGHRRGVQRPHRGGHLHHRGGRRQARPDGALGSDRRRGARRHHRAERAGRAPHLRRPAALRPGARVLAAPLRDAGPGRGGAVAGLHRLAAGAARTVPGVRGCRRGPTRRVGGLADRRPGRRRAGRRSGARA